MRTKVLQLGLLVIASLLVGYYVGVSKVSFEWKNYKPSINVINQEPPTSVTSVDFAPFWNVWQKIQTSYYDKSVLNPQKLLNGAISGMVQSLGDPYTLYLPPEQNTDFKQGLAGQFEGIGAELGMKGKQTIVISPLDSSPAQKAGLKAGDVILKVDGQSVDGWTLSQTVTKIRGPKGSNVTLTILHKDQSTSVDVKITRDTITVKSVTMWIKSVKDIDGIKLTDTLKSHEDDQVAYIRLSQFGDNTNQEWVPLANKLAAEAGNKKIRGLILDIRNNPGGYLSDATFIASEFIKGGTVVSEEKGNGEKIDFPVSRKGVLMDIPMVVLINKGSASASEIVAGALRDWKRAKLIGETSFGKGTIQEASDLGGGAGLHVTVAKWLTPNGTWVNGKGLSPDITVSLDQNDPTRDTQLEKAAEELVK